jgi:DNA-binding LacI/PurR family transcriptional regulator
MASNTKPGPRKTEAGATSRRAVSARKKPATLADVARHSGVVAMTASRAINRTGYVSRDVRERVLKAAKQLNYRPNMLARSLKGQRLNAIGIMLPDIANPFSAELVKGINEVIDEAGYTAFIALAGSGVERERAGLQSFVDHRVDGLLVATRGTLMGDEVLKELGEHGIPIVTVGRPVKSSTVDCITADHWQGAFDVTTHLIALGHKRIGFIGISPEDAHTLRRYEGYKAALEAAGLPVREEYTVGPAHAPAFATQEDGYEGLVRLSQLKKPPTAAFARNDFAAIGALRAAHAVGLAVPQQMAIAGFDNIPLSAFTTPPLTTVRQSIIEQGRMAAQILLGRIEGTIKGPRQLHSLPCQLLVRGSTDPNAGEGKG